MTISSISVNAKPTMTGSIAPLKNVAIFSEMTERVATRDRNLPGLAIFSGPSGYGKTRSAIYAANKRQAYYVEVGESWTKKKFVEALMQTIGLPRIRSTIADMIDEIVEALVMQDRPLIIDEADFIFKRRYHETVREIHDKSEAPIILIGEEMLPQLIAGASERFHNRVLVWSQAQPVDAEDARHLARLYCRDVEIDEALFQRLVEASQGRARRLCVNLTNVRERAMAQGLSKITEKEWGDAPLFTGRPPAIRRVA